MSAAPRVARPVTISVTSVKREGIVLPRKVQHLVIQRERCNLLVELFQQHLHDWAHDRLIERSRSVRLENPHLFVDDACDRIGPTALRCLCRAPAARSVKQTLDPSDGLGDPPGVEVSPGSALAGNDHLETMV